MKKNNFILLLIFLSIFFLVEPSDKSNHNQTITPYQVYFMVKGYLKFVTYEFLGYFSFEKLNSSVIYCSHCQSQITISRLLGHLIVFTTDEEVVKEIFDVLSNGTKQELDDLLLSCATKYSMPCYAYPCGTYHGWSLSKEQN